LFKLARRAAQLKRSAKVMKPTSDHSFPAAEVVSWKLSAELLELEVSNVFFAGEARGPAKLVFPLVKPVSAGSFDYTLNQWVNEPDVERLKNIQEFYFKKERHYSLKGSGAESGKFLALGFLSSAAQITWLKEKPNQPPDPTAPSGRASA
jgi:hypothetical protein